MRTKERSRQTVRTVCFALVLTAAVLRLCAEMPWSGAQRAALFLSLGISELPEADEPSADPTDAPPRAGYEKMEFSLPRTGMSFSAEDAALVPIANRVGAVLDTAALITQPVSFDLSAEGPLVLVTHTHATEAYTMTADAQYDPTSDYRTEDPAHNVVRVGQALTDRLNALGIETLHDTQLHDLEGYNDAYDRTEAVLADYLARYPSIQMVIDVHRDAVEDASGRQLALTAEVNGADYARLLLVMGTDIGGLEHPNWRDNLAFAMKLQAQGERTAAGLFRELSLRSSRYNEHLTPHSLLLEVGTAGNTLQQALRSAEFFADTLARVLLGR